MRLASTPIPVQRGPIPKPGRLPKAGVDLNSVSQLMGHAHLSTTAGYLRLARPGQGAGPAALALLSNLPPMSLPLPSLH